MSTRNYKFKNSYEYLSIALFHVILSVSSTRVIHADNITIIIIEIK